MRQVAGKIFGRGGVDIGAGGVVYRVEQLAQLAHCQRIGGSGCAVGDDFFHDKNCSLGVFISSHPAVNGEIKHPGSCCISTKQGAPGSLFQANLCIECFGVKRIIECSNLLELGTVWKRYAFNLATFIVHGRQPRSVAHEPAYPHQTPDCTAIGGHERPTENRLAHGLFQRDCQTDRPHRRLHSGR
ncbi:hypothetical protein EMIT0232MI5_10102 [Pseudomonas sp. IT-232MI5]